jgi:tripartite-type tricarboxylate transporter receptor subunit TctC
MSLTWLSGAGNATVPRKSFEIGRVLMGLKSLFLKCFYGAAITMTAGAATAQNFPAHPLRVIIPYPPGGGTDIILRMIAPGAGTILRQSIIVENRPGASSIIGTGAVVRAPADGYTLLATDSALLINPGLFKTQLPYDTLNQLKGVTMMATSPALLVVNPSVPARNLAELLVLAKSKPGKFAYGSGGVGTAPHLAGELMKLAAGIDVRHIPYKGTGPALTAVLAGQVDMAFVGISSVGPFVVSGQLRATALAGQQRNPSLPDVPTFEENNLDVDGSSYWGIYAPTGVPDTIIDQLNRAFTRALRAPDNEKKLADLGFMPIANSPQQHTAQLRTMVAQWTAFIDRASIKVE